MFSLKFFRIIYVLLAISAFFGGSPIHLHPKTKMMYITQLSFIKSLAATSLIFFLDAFGFVRTLQAKLNSSPVMMVSWSYILTAIGLVPVILGWATILQMGEYKAVINAALKYIKGLEGNAKHARLGHNLIGIWG